MTRLTPQRRLRRRLPVVMPCHCCCRLRVLRGCELCGTLHHGVGKASCEVTRQPLAIGCMAVASSAYCCSSNSCCGR